MKNYINIDGIKIPISDETARSLKESFGNKLPRAEKGKEYWYEDKMSVYKQCIKLLNRTKPFNLTVSSDLITLAEADKLRRKGLKIRFNHREKEIVVTNIKTNKQIRVVIL